MPAPPLQELDVFERLHAQVLFAALLAFRTVSSGALVFSPHCVDMLNGRMG